MTEYWHQVRSFGTHNLAVSVLFSRIKSFSGVNCEQPAYKSLDQFDVVWVYNGTGTMSMGNMDVEDLREMLLTFTDDDDDRLYRKRMLEEVEELQSTFNNNAAASAYQRVQKAFDKVLDPLGKGYVTREQLSTLTRDQLKALAVAFEPPEPSNTYEFEYSLFDAADIRYIIESLAREDSLTLEQFIRAYTDKDSVFGSTKIAKDVFSVLDKEGNGHVTMEQLQDGRLEAALEPFHYYQPRDSIPERMFVHNHDEL
jgi:Ca2+-binding EF-hand superfamily protein